MGALLNKCLHRSSSESCKLPFLVFSSIYWHNSRLISSLTVFPCLGGCYVIQHGKILSYYNADWIFLNFDLKWLNYFQELARFWWAIKYQALERFRVLCERLVWGFKFASLCSWGAVKQSENSLKEAAKYSCTRIQYKVIRDPDTWRKCTMRSG